ncbi:MAG: hypothetical protein MUP53_04780, partial [Bacteroidales bacterium]|nr:hypothetical protein [Bacteroidales bacterium]
MTKLYQKLLKPGVTTDEIRRGVAEATLPAAGEERIAVMKALFSFLDLTSLNTYDNPRIIKGFTEKVGAFKDHFPGMNNVAAVCVFPNFVQTAIEG